jgi:hypothetical protein
VPAQAPGLLKTLREHSPDYVFLDETLSECDRLGDGRTDYSAKHRRHGVNVQVVTDPEGRLLWISPALPGRAHDLTAACTHRIIRTCERQGRAGDFGPSGYLGRVPRLPLQPQEIPGGGVCRAIGRPSPCCRSAERVIVGEPKAGPPADRALRGDGC